jgi:hypothetical protein
MGQSFGRLRFTANDVSLVAIPTRRVSEGPCCSVVSPSLTRRVGMMRHTRFYQGDGPLIWTLRFMANDVSLVTFPTRRVSFEVALLERFCWPKAFIIVAWGIAPGIENKGK